MRIETWINHIEKVNEYTHCSNVSRPVLMNSSLYVQNKGTRPTPTAYVRPQDFLKPLKRQKSIIIIKKKSLSNSKFEGLKSPRERNKKCDISKLVSSRC